MSTDSLYRSWNHPPQSTWWGVAAMVRVGIGLIFRRWLFWLLIGLGLLNFLFNFALIYIKAQITAESPDVGRFIDSYRVTGTGTAYADFMLAQASITALLLAFAGSTLVGGDYRQGGLVFYLSRRLSRLHYIVGKLLTVATLVTLITTVPAIVLFIECGTLTTSFEYFRDNWRILRGILGYGVVLAIVQSLMLCALASLVPRTAPLVMSWLGLFVLLKALGESLRNISDNRLWRLLSIWDDMDRVGKYCFGSLIPGRGPTAWQCLLVLIGVAVFCLLILFWRVRAVEVVK